MVEEEGGEVFCMKTEEVPRCHEFFELVEKIVYSPKEQIARLHDLPVGLVEIGIEARGGHKSWELL